MRGARRSGTVTAMARIPETRPFGSWRSPVTAASLVATNTGLASVQLDGDDTWWIESRSTDGGRSVLVRRTPDGEQRDVVGAPFNVRSRVHEYGGGAYTVRDGLVLFVDFTDQRVRRLDPDGGEARPITPEGEWRYGDLRIDAARGVAYAVREDHSGDGEPRNTLVRLDLDGPNEDGGTVLVDGTDFVVGPELSPDGDRLAWLEWDHPHMPWEESRIGLGTLDDAGRLTTRTVWAAEPGVSFGEPRWAPDGRLVFLCDRSGFANLYAADVAAPRREPTSLLPLDREFGGPQWQLGASSFGFTAAGRVVCRWLEDGFGRLGVLDPDGGLTVIRTGATAYTEVAVQGERVAVLAGFADAPAGVGLIEPTDGSCDFVRRSSDQEVDTRYHSSPEPVTWHNAQGDAVHGFYYPPVNADFRAPAGELPPLIVCSHGGPTGMSPPMLQPDYQYWTSRGIALLDVNYGGSTGYGRAYRERLQGNWGIVDVEDCTSGALAMAEQERADATRLVIHGGSAGGYTTLAALTFRDVFAAGASHFGISDLSALARDTHKFESRYPLGLVGPYPEAQEVYDARSPIKHVDQLSSPMILLQGTEDKVVPPDQATLMADTLRAKGIAVALVMFEGEAHGFRQGDNIMAALEAEAYFLSRVLGFTLADDVPVVPIDNLPG